MPQGSDPQVTAAELAAAPAEPASVSEPTLGDIVAGIARDSRRIMSGYVELAKLDIRRELAEVGRAVTFTVLAVAAAAVGLLLLLIALVRGITWWTGLPPAASYAVVGGGVVVVAAVMGWLGRRAVHKAEVPQVVEEAKEDLTWMRDNA